MHTCPCGGDRCTLSYKSFISYNIEYFSGIYMQVNLHICGDGRANFVHCKEHCSANTSCAKI